MRGFPFYQQLDAMDCGPSCLRMIAKYHGRSYSLQFLRERSYLDREGVSLKGISEAAESIGFRTMAVKVSFGGKKKDPCLLSAPLPVVAHWNQKHFIVVYKVSKNKVMDCRSGCGKIQTQSGRIRKRLVK